MLLICQQGFLFNDFLRFFIFYKNAFLTFFYSWGQRFLYIYGLNCPITNTHLHLNPVSTNFSMSPRHEKPQLCYISENKRIMIELNIINGNFAVIVAKALPETQNTFLYTPGHQFLF